MRWFMIVWAMVLNLALAAASIWCLVILLGWGKDFGWDSTLSQLMDRLENLPKYVHVGIFVSISALLVVVDLFFLHSLSRRRDSSKKFISFENDLGDVVIEVSALENCLQRMVYDTFDVNNVKCEILVPTTDDSSPIICNMAPMLRERNNITDIATQIQKATEARFNEILPLSRRIKVNVTPDIQPAKPSLVKSAFRQEPAAPAVEPVASQEQEVPEPDEYEEEDDEVKDDGEESSFDLDAPAGLDPQMASDIPNVPAAENQNPQRSVTDRLIIPVQHESSEGEKNEDTSGA